MSRASDRRADPLGKRALFWWPEQPEARDQRDVDEDVLLGRGRVAVDCSSCGVRSRIGVLDLAAFKLPWCLWLPRGRYSHRMTCPACRRRTWVAIRISLRPTTSPRR